MYDKDYPVRVVKRGNGLYGLNKKINRAEWLKIKDLFFYRGDGWYTYRPDEVAQRLGCEWEKGR